MKLNRNDKFLLASIFVYITVLSFASYLKLVNGFYDNLDLAIFSSTLYNLVTGNGLFNAIHPPTYLGDHFTPILFLISPLYFLWKNPLALLIFQTIVIGFTSWPIYLIAKKYLSNNLALLPSLLWLLNPVTHNINFFEFHVLPIAILALLFSFYFYQQKNFSYFLLFIILSLLVREDISLIIFCFGILALIDKRELKWKLLPPILSVIYFFIAQAIIFVNSAASRNKFSSYYEWLEGAGVLDYVSHFFSPGNLELFVGLFFPLLFIPLLKPKYLIFLVPPVIVFLLTRQGGSSLLLETHYGGFFIWSIFVAFIFALKKLEDYTWYNTNRPLIIICLLTASLFSSIYYGPLYAFSKEKLSYQINNSLEIIPPRDSVAASYSYLGLLSTRKNLQSLPYIYGGFGQFGLTSYALDPTTDWLVINWADMLKTQVHYSGSYSKIVSQDDLASNMATLLGQFEPVSIDDQVIIYKRNEAGISLSSLSTSDLDGEARILNMVNENLGNFELTKVEIFIPKNSNKYFYLETPNNLYPVGYQQYNLASLGENSVITMYIPITSDATLSSWTSGYIYLNDIRSVGVKLQDSEK